MDTVIRLVDASLSQAEIIVFDAVGPRMMSRTHELLSLAKRAKFSGQHDIIQVLGVASLPH